MRGVERGGSRRERGGKRGTLSLSLSPFRKPSLTGTEQVAWLWLHILDKSVYSILLVLDSAGSLHLVHYCFFLKLSNLIPHPSTPPPKPFSESLARADHNKPEFSFCRLPRHKPAQYDVYRQRVGGQEDSLILAAGVRESFLEECVP